MYTIGTLPTFVTISPPPDRTEALSNPQMFALKYRQFNLDEKTFVNTNMPYTVNWMNQVHSNVGELYTGAQGFRNDALNARDTALVYKNEALSYWTNIQGYTIPSGASYSIAAMDSKLNEMAWEIGNNMMRSIQNEINILGGN